MADSVAASPPPAPAAQAGLEGGTYEIIRGRLNQHAAELRARLARLNDARKAVFGAVETRLLSSVRVATSNKCVPRDMLLLGNRFLLGYNVFIGLRAETRLEDVFAVYEWSNGEFQPRGLELLGDSRFAADFRNLYRYYRGTTFAKFARIGPYLYMAFRVSPDPRDVKTFKWLVRDDRLEYLDNRSDHEFVFPPQHEFEWTRVTHDMHHGGVHPHVSIEDRVFVEAVGGDLTVKIEDNTASGEGIYSEPVDNPDQTLDDAEILYAVVGNIVLLKVRPYQESAFRHLVFNHKLRQVVRIDSIADACLLLPDGHGLIFPAGCYLQTGGQKLFNMDMRQMLFERRVASPNGEDHLFAFYNRDGGLYALLGYNVISQQVGTPLVCSGFSLFEDGRLCCFRAGEEPQHHHVIQIWQTPYCAPDHGRQVVQDSTLYKIGNQDIVRCMADCTALLTLVDKEDSYANLYADIARGARDVRDAYFWVGDEQAADLASPLAGIADAAGSAIEEFERVVRTRRDTAAQVARVAARVGELVRRAAQEQMTDINAYVSLLADFRAARGEAISLKDLRYVDAARIEDLDGQVAARTEDLSARCVRFLLAEESLRPYHERVAAQAGQIDGLAKVADARRLGEDVAATGRELEMLTEIVSNLKIDDATQTTAIIDSVSLVYQRLNQVKGRLSGRLAELGRVEGQAEFSSQLKLLAQTAAGYLDVCDAPQKCDDYLSRVMAQVESLEARFADFDEFVVQLSDRRTELYEAFEGRKVQLVEARNRRAGALMTAAERVLKGVANRVAGMDDINAINGYFAADLMIERLRETVAQLEALGDTVKAEDVRSRLKSIQQDAIRQLKDRQALYEDGQNVIRLGAHRFAVNRQPLELTVVNHDGRMCLHLTGTGFFEPIADEQFLTTRDVWGLEVVSESPQVYRAEFLAWQLLSEDDSPAAIASIASAAPQELLARVQQFMAPRYAEGYVKGVHDADAAAILRALARMRSTIGLLRYAPAPRALATVFWELWDGGTDKSLVSARLGGLGELKQLFDRPGGFADYVAELTPRIERFARDSGLFPPDLAAAAADYLFHELAGESRRVGTGAGTGPRTGRGAETGKGAETGPGLGVRFIVSQAASEVCSAFLKHLERKGFRKRFEQSLSAVRGDPPSVFRLCREWVRAYLSETAGPNGQADYLDEASASLAASSAVAADRPVVAASTACVLEGLLGSHPRIRDGRMELDYCDFVTRLDRHRRTVVPALETYQAVRKRLIEQSAEQLRLDEFKPRVLTTFVRNRLIDKVYLPLLGDNLARQIGSAGEQKRTDRQGLLLLISPPGYGKTTLMEYIANRLGLIFVKINGPALGSRVTSLDPDEAPNAASRQEIHKANLAFEMGDNVMLYLDDIQHVSPELLQKFISLCDSQRRVEGVYRGRTRTYDLRGKRVCVVMAGNPYTESGQRFRIPDMLANRADTYNIGDIVGDNHEAFVDSYVENCLTSNPVLARLANRSQADVYAVMKLASGQDAESVQFEGNYSADELDEYVATMRKLFTVREVVLKVNQQYIRSAGQADDYRTEPPFLLQGSYRNMNRIAARVLAVMNEQELWTLIVSSYDQDAQTLTAGAESNLLKFKELTGRLTDAETARWEEIKRTFRRRLLLGGADDDKASQIIRQLNAFSGGLESISAAVDKGVTRMSEKRDGDDAARTAARLAEQLEGIRAALEKSAASAPQANDQLHAVGQAVLDRIGQVIEAVRGQGDLVQRTARRHEALTINDNAQTLVAVLEEQFRLLQTWLEPIERSPEGRARYADELVGRFEQMVAGYNRLIEVLKDRPSPDAKSGRNKQ